MRDHVWGARLDIRTHEHEKIVVDRRREAAYIPPGGDVRVQQAGRNVRLLLGTKMLEMTTPVAVKVGMSLAKNGGACQYLGDVVLFEIGGEEFTLLPDTAVKVGGALLRKADKADDFQRRLQ